jgi:hypothetical protein
MTISWCQCVILACIRNETIAHSFRRSGSWFGICRDGFFRRSLLTRPGRLFFVRIPTTAARIKTVLIGDRYRRTDSYGNARGQKTSR